MEGDYVAEQMHGQCHGTRACYKCNLCHWTKSVPEHAYDNVLGNVCLGTEQTGFQPTAPTRRQAPSTTPGDPFSKEECQYSSNTPQLGAQYDAELSCLYMHARMHTLDERAHRCIWTQVLFLL